MSSAFTVSATATGTIDITQAMSSAFTLAVSDVDFLDNHDTGTYESIPLYVQNGGGYSEIDGKTFDLI